MADTHHPEITRLYRDLAVFAAGFIPSKIALEPGRSDIMEQIEDLRKLAAKVDRIVEATAQYVDASAGYTIAPEWSADQLSKALDGNLFHEIEMAADEAVARLVEHAA